MPPVWAALFSGDLMKRHLALFALLLITLGLLCQDASYQPHDPLSRYNAMLFKYTNNLHSDNRVGFGVNVPLSHYYIIESDFINFSWVHRDPFNKGKSNYNVFPVVDMALIYLMSATLPKDKQETIFLLPLFFTNAYHDFYLLGNPDYEKKDQRTGFNLALFIKNSTNYFPFRTHTWLETAPGAGIKFYYNSMALDFGVQRKWRFAADVGRSHDDELFFGLSGYIVNWE